MIINTVFNAIFNPDKSLFDILIKIFYKDPLQYYCNTALSFFQLIYIFFSNFSGHFIVKEEILLQKHSIKICLNVRNNREDEKICTGRDFPTQNHLRHSFYQCTPGTSHLSKNLFARIPGHLHFALPAVNFHTHCVLVPYS